MKSLKNPNHSLKVLVFLALITLVACAGKTPPAAKDKTASVDLTRPPVTISADQGREQESNPDETISFEEWSKEQQAAPESDE